MGRWPPRLERESIILIIIKLLLLLLLQKSESHIFIFAHCIIASLIPFFVCEPPTIRTTTRDNNTISVKSDNKQAVERATEKETFFL